MLWVPNGLNKLPEMSFEFLCTLISKSTKQSSGDEDDINEESSSESDYINCVTLTPDSISTVEHRENAQEIYAEMILKGKAI